jgi:queuine/archaeosine tRNA-ribosyltransferase
MAGEMLGPILVSLHNVRHFQRLMSDLRETIRTDDWRGFRSRWPASDPDAPSGGGGDGAETTGFCGQNE